VGRDFHDALDVPGAGAERDRSAPPSVLAPTDLFPFSMRSVAYAADLTRKLQGTLHLLHVTDPPNVAEGGTTLDGIEVRHKNRVDYVLRHTAGHRGGPILANPVTAALARYHTDSVIRGLSTGG
jgi:hypothetical protein